MSAAFPLPQRPRTTIFQKTLRQSLLLVSAAILGMGFTAFLLARTTLTDRALSGIADGTATLQTGTIDIVRLGGSFVLIAFLLLLLAAILAYLLARDLTVPVRTLAEAASRLGPARWSVNVQVKTGDEIELLGHALSDMAGRLRALYEHLEEQVRERTRELTHQYAIDRGILDGIQQGVLLIDQEGHITAGNPAAQTLLQCPKDALIGSGAEATLLLRSHRGEALTGNHPVRACLATQDAFHSDPGAHVCLLRPDGTLLPVLLVVTPFFQDAQILGCIVVIQDVTEERQIDYMKSDFITLASHQMRTPLSAMRWYVELLGEEAGFNDQQRSYLSEMQRAVLRMINLLNALLRAARVEGEGSAPDRETVDLRAIVQEMGEAMAPEALELGIHLQTALPDDTVRLFTDPVLQRIIIQNLLSNALKYSRKDSAVEMRLSTDPGFVQIAVEDHGVGIPVAEQPKVFQKFFRAKNVRTLDTDGNGLGLYITKSMVEKLGGQIGFRSAEGKGSIFTVRFPLRRDKQ